MCPSCARSISGLGREPQDEPSPIKRHLLNQRPILQAAGILHTEVLVDLARRVGAIEGVEVEPADLVVEQVPALFGGPVDADLADGLGRVGTTAEAPRSNRAGNRAPSASSAIRARFSREVIGMIPARIGTRMPARSHRSRKS